MWILRSFRLDFADRDAPCRGAHREVGLIRIFRLRHAETNTATPAPISAAVEISTFATASALCGSSPGGITDSTIVSAVQAKPITARATATGRPPGTCMASGAAGRLCNRIMEANRNRYGRK